MSTIDIGDRPFPAIIHVKRGSELRRYAPERTCRMTFLWSDFEDGECYECSRCGEVAFTHGGAPSYCPNCGAKVEP